MRSRFRSILAALGSLLVFSAGLAQESPLSLTSQPLQQVQHTREHQFAAQVISPNTAQLSGEISATILHIHVRPGHLVSKDAPLIELDCRDYIDQLALLNARLNETQASLTQAQRLAARLSSLRERQLTDSLSAEDAASEVTRQSARLSAIRTEISLAERQISRCTLYAPFDAVVLEQLTSVGERTAPGTALLVLQQWSHAEIEVNLPLNRFTLTTGFQAEFHVNQQRFPVELLRVSPSLNPLTRSQTAWFSAPEEIAIGTSGSLKITEQAAFIPANLIVKRQGQLGIFIIENNTPVFVPLAHAEEGRPYPISDELSDVEIVVQGHQWLEVGVDL